MNSVPPAMRSCTLADRDGDAGGGAGDAVDHADLSVTRRPMPSSVAPSTWAMKSYGPVTASRCDRAEPCPAMRPSSLLDRLGLAGAVFDQDVRFHAALGGLVAMGASFGQRLGRAQELRQRQSGRTSASRRTGPPPHPPGCRAPRCGSPGRTGPRAARWPRRSRERQRFADRLVAQPRDEQEHPTLVGAGQVGKARLVADDLEPLVAQRARRPCCARSRSPCSDKKISCSARAEAAVSTRAAKREQGASHARAESSRCARRSVRWHRAGSAHPQSSVMGPGPRGPVPRRRRLGLGPPQPGPIARPVLGPRDLAVEIGAQQGHDGRQLAQPHVDLLLADAARPVPHDQDARAVRGYRGLVHALGGDAAGQAGGRSRASAGPRPAW